MPPALLAPELTASFPCFGTTVRVTGSGPDDRAVRTAIARAQGVALDLHHRLTRFEPDSELSRLNADPRTRVPAGPLLRRLAAAIRWAGEVSDGLVDATCLPALQAAGYVGDFGDGSDGWVADPTAAAPLPGAWRAVRVDGGDIVRPPGVLLDSGGLGKGLACDLMAAELRDCDAWVVDCAGDLRLGGTAAVTRPVHVADPCTADAPPITTLELTRSAVATSGITRRAWSGGHHLIDPRTGRPADTGLLQVTALAPTGLLAETRAKSALLSGPEGAAHLLPDGGVLVTADGAVTVVPRLEQAA